MRGGRWSRPIGWALTALAVVATGPLAALAQEASPAASPVASPAVLGEAIVSPTRAEWTAAYEAEMAFSEPATPGGTFLGSAVTDIQTVMPFLAEEETSLGVVGFVFDTLFGSDPVTGVPVPTGLADSWEISPDRLTYTFHLNPDAVFHDGVPVTAEDVEFSFDALADEATGSVYTGGFVAAVASYRVVDEHTFELTAKEPTVDFLYNLAAFIVPKHVWENVPRDQWRTDPGATGEDPSRVVGSGPFRFQEWIPGESITLSKFDQFYGKVPYIDEYVLRIWPDQTAAVNALLNGEIDAAGLSPADVAAVEGTPGIEVVNYPNRGFSYILLNQNPEMTTLFVDPKVRQALYYALDRESIVNDIMLGYARVAQGTQPQISYAFDPEAIRTRYGYDPEKAKALLAEADWTDTDGDGIVDKDGQPLSFEYLYGSGSPTGDQLAAYLQDAWRAVGVEVTPRALEFAALIEATSGDQPWDASALGFGWDATFIQDIMFGCAQYRVGFNDMKYCNPKVDEINQQAKREFDDEARAQLLIEASNLVNDDAAILTLFFRDDIVAYSDRIQNFEPGPWGGVPLNYLWIQQ